jgi:hypothetical protein
MEITDRPTDQEFLVMGRNDEGNHAFAGHRCSVHVEVLPDNELSRISRADLFLKHIGE